MARFRYEDRIPHPLEACYAAMRDRMTEFTPYLKGVREIRVVERREVAPGETFIVNEWVSDYDPPSVVGRFITPDMLRWLDIVTWRDATRSWDWRFESAALKSALSAKGTNCMKDAGGGATTFVIEGDLDILVEKMPGVPAFLGRRVRPQVERFILGLIEPRLRGIDQGLSAFLDAEAK
ncbi:MAG TPA: hypothetical protein VHF22_02595 [Planctomycetota bacterium]|nr:hypothetical protein [Planctomycetota bacterium]